MASGVEPRWRRRLKEIETLRAPDMAGCIMFDDMMIANRVCVECRAKIEV